MTYAAAWKNAVGAVYDIINALAAYTGRVNYLRRYEPGSLPTVLLHPLQGDLGRYQLGTGIETVQQLDVWLILKPGSEAAAQNAIVDGLGSIIDALEADPTLGGDAVTWSPRLFYVGKVAPAVKIYDGGVFGLNIVFDT